MRRLLLVTAAAASVAFPSGSANANPVCYNGGGGCVWVENDGTTCWYERGVNGNSRTICAGPGGVSECYDNFPDGTWCRNVRIVPDPDVRG